MPPRKNSDAPEIAPMRACKCPHVMLSATASVRRGSRSSSFFNSCAISMRRILRQTLCEEKPAFGLSATSLSIFDLDWPMSLLVVILSDSEESHRIARVRFLARLGMTRERLEERAKAHVNQRCPSLLFPAPPGSDRCP